MFQTSMRMIEASEVVMVPYLTFLSAIVRFGVLLVAAAALLAAVGLASRTAYFALRRFIVLFRCIHLTHTASRGKHTSCAPRG